MWQDAGTWIALGVSALFLVAGIVMHRVFVKILKGDAESTPANEGGAPTRPQTHE